MIKEFKTSKGDFLWVLVPDDAIEICLKSYLNVIEYRSDRYLDGQSTTWITIPDYEYKIIGIQTEITEEQAKEIVMEMKRSDFPFEITPALDTFHYLMQKLEIKPDTKTLIIQKIK